MAHVLWYSENMELRLKEEKHLSFIQRLKLNKNMLLDAVADIYKAKK